MYLLRALATEKGERKEKNIINIYKNKFVPFINLILLDRKLPLFTF